MHFKGLLFVQFLFFGTFFVQIKTIEAFIPTILLHGTAGDFPNNENLERIHMVCDAYFVGYRTLRETNSSLDAVVAAVQAMENSKMLNHVYKSIQALNKTIEMEAAVMRGSDLAVGSISHIRGIKHPVGLARMVLEKYPNRFLDGEDAMNFAREQGVKISEILNETEQPVMERGRKARELMGNDENNPADDDSKLKEVENVQDALNSGEVSHVGAVAIDAEGRIAVATSRAGIVGEYMSGIVQNGFVGTGIYADDRFGGVSTTGHEESIKKFVLAKDVINRIAFKGQMSNLALKDALKEMEKVTGGKGGGVTLDINGQYGLQHTSNKMPGAFRAKDPDTHSLFCPVKSGERFSYNDIFKEWSL